MIIAAAQTKPYTDIHKNIETHKRLIIEAAKNKAKLILFPEMSLTGYEREKAKKIVFHQNDERLNEIQTLANEHQIYVVAGAPIRLDSQIHIGSFLLIPNDEKQIYTKQFLHDGEEKYFNASFGYFPSLYVQNERLALAVCADIEHEKHVSNASKMGSTLYLASIFYTPEGIESMHAKMSFFAKKYAISIMVSNFSEESYGMPAGGNSAFWDSKGQQIGKLNDSEENLLLIEKESNNWKMI